MFFILSKILDFLLSPALWILVLLMYGFVVRNRKVLAAGLILLIVFTNPFFANEAFRAWERPPVVLDKSYDAAIVLTGFTIFKENMPERTFFNKGADRLLHTVELYKAGKIKKIIITGGSGSLLNRNVSEAQQVKRAFMYSGVPDSVLITEGRSSNTAENALMTRKLIDSLNIKGEFLLVTSAFHMRRAEGCFEKVGIEFNSFPVDIYSRGRGWTPNALIIPTETALDKWAVLIHEIAGYVVYKITGKL
jgi:uncharacterized SAM-binding protein YcdF (DUF218 family)